MVLLNLCPNFSKVILHISESKRLAITYGALAVRRRYRQCRHLSWSQVSSSLFVVLSDVPSLPFPHRRRHRHAPNPSLLSYNMSLKFYSLCRHFPLFNLNRCSETIEMVVIAMFASSVMISFFVMIFFWKDLFSSNEMSSNPRNYGSINGILLCWIQAVGYNLGTQYVIREVGFKGFEHYEYRDSCY